MKRYINTKYNNEVESIDELSLSDFNSYKEFKTELKRLVSEYMTAFNQYCYSSQRSTKNWSN